MSEYSAEILSALESIDATLKELLVLSKSKRATAPSNVATDADLDSQYGDPKSNFKPRDWTGEWVKGQLFSESHPAMLDLLAPIYESFYEKKKAENDPKARYELESAKRARGWAARLRAGWKPKTPSHVPASDIQW